MLPARTSRVVGVNLRQQRLLQEAQRKDQAGDGSDLMPDSVGPCPLSQICPLRLAMPLGHGQSITMEPGPASIWIVWRMALVAVPRRPVAREGMGVHSHGETVHHAELTCQTRGLNSRAGGGI
jgi:hypothetical protein